MIILCTIIAIVFYLSGYLHGRRNGLREAERIITDTDVEKEGSK